MRKRILSILLAIMGIALAVFLILACGSYASGDASFNTASNGVYRNLMGAPGAYTADLLWQGFGFIALLFPVALMAWSILTVFNLCAWVKLRIYLFIPAVLLGCWLLADVALDDPAFAKAGAGGYIGHFLATFGTLNAWYWLALAWALFAGLVIFSFKLPAMRMAVWTGRAVTSKLGRVSMPHPRFSWFSFKRKTANEHDATDFADAPVSDEPTRHVAVKMRKKAEPKPRKEPQLDSFKPDKSAFVLPSAALLAPAKAGGPTISADMMARISKDLENVLSQFGVNGKIVGANPGPVVTLYEFEPASGVKTARVISLADDIAREMRAVSVRIAVVPGSNTIGIEMPNVKRDTVYIRELVENAKFKDNPGALALILGKDIGGTPVYADLAKMPHLLVAGTTGSGKSVAINTMILSLLYRLTPAQCRMIMVDPKMLELSVYNGIPHLYIPVVTDPKKAAGALQWAVTEMLKRYRLFSELGVRSIDAYNDHLKENGQPKMPNIVVVIDELADLMLVASKDVEESICRVAQMGRAAGMHLVIATQRPSADVITGLMKANIPSRIAFAVSSALESRIILDNAGAEKLIVMGDMLYAPIGCGKPLRVQGAFVSDEERDSIVEFIKRQSTAQYSEGVIAQIEKAAEDKGASGKGRADDDDESDARPEYDELLPQAVDVIFDTKQASVSMLQRRLKLGYSRAARIVDQMEEMGIVGPFEGSKPRQILITRDQWLEMQTTQGTAPTETLRVQTEFADEIDDI